MPQEARYTSKMRGQFYHLVRQMWGDLTSATGYGDWEGTPAWRDLGECILANTGEFELPVAHDPQAQVESFIRDCSDEQFEVVVQCVVHVHNQLYSDKIITENVLNEQLKHLGMPLAFVNGNPTPVTTPQITLVAERDPAYDIAQICANGHLITAFAARSPEGRRNFCARCGELTIDRCTMCTHYTRGVSVSASMPSHFEYSVPAFCADCGDPYPWTQRALMAARTLADELEILNAAEKEELKSSLNDMVKETPQTQVAVTRFKRIMKKVGTEGAGAFKEILVNVLSETTRKLLLAGP